MAHNQLLQNRLIYFAKVGEKELITTSDIKKFMGEIRSNERVKRKNLQFKSQKMGENQYLVWRNR